MRPSALFTALVDLALPPRCPGCGEVVEADHRFCSGCWAGLRFLGDPACSGCGRPFVHGGGGSRCAPCLAQPPVHAGVRAAVAYGPVARELALRLKYGGRLALADTAARLMVRHLPAGPVLLLPVPLHRRRIWQRGYNQAALLARGLARRHPEAAVALDALVRTRPTPPLRGLGRAARARTLRGAFAVTRPEVVRGRQLVLIDDVHTSGATSDACARVLLRAGAAEVSVLCWARVLDETVD